MSCDAREATDPGASQVSRASHAPSDQHSPELEPPVAQVRVVFRMVKKLVAMASCVVLPVSM